jgi:hypothetical protein
VYEYVLLTANRQSDHLRTRLPLLEEKETQWLVAEHVTDDDVKAEEHTDDSLDPAIREGEGQEPFDSGTCCGDVVLW